ncbi:armadillo repeat-containing protein 8 isoform X2, partial [Tachysurus ichikawai]
MMDRIVSGLSESSIKMSPQFVAISTTAEDEFPRSCSVEAANE